jgi:ABC-type glycerol-3-phosphate transport system substrate-binding protein/DNA-binding transcriptional regulator YhcF (GntR family)
MAGAIERGIDPDHLIPLYAQLKMLLLEDILRGRYAPGEQLPTEHQLCATYRISRTPVSRALSELAAEGVLTRHRRRGTLVNPHWQRRDSDRPELRIVVPDGPWERLLRSAAPEGIRLNIATMEFPDLRRTLVHAVAAGRAPDLAVLDSVWVAEFASAGFLLPLDELDPRWVAQEYEPGFVEALIAAARFDGHPVAMPVDADVAGLWYRRPALAQAGIESLSGWSDLAALGAWSAGRVPAPIVLPGGSRGGETTSYCLLAFLAANGAQVLDGDQVVLHGPATVECLEYLRELAGRGTLPEETVAFEWDRAARMLGRGQAVVSFGGSYEASALASAAGLSAKALWDEFGFTGMPQGPRGGARTLAGVMVMGVFRQTSNRELAMRMLRKLASADELTTVSIATGRLPPRRSAFPVAADVLGGPTAALELLNHAVIRPVTADYPRVSAQLQVMLESVLTGRRTPQEASRHAADAISAITGYPRADRSDAS